MKRIVFETANSIGHYDLPDGFDVTRLSGSNEEPLLPAFMQDGSTKSLEPETAHGSTAEVLMPTDFNGRPEKRTLDALHGDDVESNVLLPTFMNAGQLDAHEGQHGENNQNLR